MLHSGTAQKHSSREVIGVNICLCLPKMAQITVQKKQTFKHEHYDWSLDRFRHKNNVVFGLGEHLGFGSTDYFAEVRGTFIIMVTVNKWWLNLWNSRGHALKNKIKLWVWYMKQTVISPMFKYKVSLTHPSTPASSLCEHCHIMVPNNT